MITKTLYYCSDQFEPCHNLATEACLLETVAPGCCILYLWQNQKTVVIGKNQNCWKECDINRLEKDGGYLVRRLSGGGAVFHDQGNLNFTFLVHQQDYDLGKQLEVILRAVNLLGIRAEKSGRNDLTVDGRKFSGNAFYSSAGRCYHHGTILLNVEMEGLSRYLNVSREKLQSKGVDSVQSRVTNLSEHCPDITVDLMKEKLIQAFAEVYGIEPVKMNADSLSKERVQELRNRFSSWDWIYGKKIPFTFEAEKRFEWGNIQIQLRVCGGIVEQCAVYSDAMEQDLISKIDFTGSVFSSRALCESLKSRLEPANYGHPITADICRFLKEQRL